MSRASGRIASAAFQRVGRRVSIFWEDDNSSYTGTIGDVVELHPKVMKCSKKNGGSSNPPELFYLVLYDDGDAEWLNFTNEKVEWLAGIGEVDQSLLRKKRRLLKPPQARGSAGAGRNHAYARVRTRIPKNHRGVCTRLGCEGGGGQKGLVCFVQCDPNCRRVDGRNTAAEAWHHISEAEHFCGECYIWLQKKKVHTRFGGLGNMDLVATELYLPYWVQRTGQGGAQSRSTNGFNESNGKEWWLLPPGSTVRLQLQL